MVNEWVVNIECTGKEKYKQLRNKECPYLIGRNCHSDGRPYHQCDFESCKRAVLTEQPKRVAY